MNPNVKHDLAVLTLQKEVNMSQHLLAQYPTEEPKAGDTVKIYGRGRMEANWTIGESEVVGRRSKVVKVITMQVLQRKDCRNLAYEKEPAVRGGIHDSMVVLLQDAFFCVRSQTGK